MSNDLSPEEITRSHRWHAIECNNLAWRLSDEPSRDPLQDQDMLNAAHASAFHWAKVGPELHKARANMLLAHVHAALGMGRSAMAYAQQSFDEISAHQPPDWEIAFLHAVLSHAAFAAGEGDLHQSHYRKARECGEAIADPEDKEIFFKTFSHLPSP